MCLLQNDFSLRYQPRPDGSMVSVSDSRPGGCEFDPRLRRLFFPAYFRFSPLQKYVRKVVGGFGQKSCVSTGVRKPGNTCVTDRHDKTFGVKVALNPNTTNQYHYVIKPVRFKPLWTPLYIEKSGVCRGMGYFSYFSLKHRFWVLIRTASPRRF